MAAFALTCEGLTCGFHRHAVLTDISFNAEFGESIALLGSNGAGKSTLLRTVSGELKPISGAAKARRAAGENAHATDRLAPSMASQLIAIVPQEEPAPFAFTVREVVTLGRLALGSGIFDSKEDLDAADRAMEKAECSHLSSRLITELSGGEKQRVLIARALAQDAPIVLMDEPTSHLDPPHQIAVAKLLSQLAEGGKCVITAVHDLNLASSLATRAILIAEGKIAMDGPVEEVLESNRLEESYRSKFERVRTSTGRLVVVPISG